LAHSRLIPLRRHWPTSPLGPFIASLDSLTHLVPPSLGLPAPSYESHRLRLVHTHLLGSRPLRTNPPPGPCTPLTPSFTWSARSPCPYPLGPFSSNSLTASLAHFPTWTLYRFTRLAHSPGPPLHWPTPPLGPCNHRTHSPPGPPSLTPPLLLSLT
jgi:hypothetical protein